MLKNALVLFLLFGSIFISDTFAQLDTSFAGDGTKLIQFNSAGVTRDMVVQPDHKIIFIGGCNNIGTIRPFCAIRLNEDGALDTSFGNTGYVYVPIPGSTFDISAIGVVLQKDGKIVLAGGGTRLLMTRLNSDGTTDTTFGTQGFVENTAITTANKIALQPDGKFVVVGFSGAIASNSKQILARFLPDGTPDTSFGTNGVATLDIPPGRTIGVSLDIQPDGKIVTGGALSGATTSYLLARFNRNGSLDTTFDGDGFLTVNSGSISFTEFGYFNSVKVKSDGRIVALGDRNTVYSFNANGSPDTTFDGDGARTALIDGDPYAMNVSTSGKIIVAGNPFITGNNQIIDYRTAKYLADGSNDPNYSFFDINIEGNDGATAVLFDRKGRTFFGGKTGFVPPPVPFAQAQFSAARLLAPPTQNVGFSGKVIDLNGKPVLNALIVLKDGETVIANARTNPFGNFRFNNIATNQTYTITTIAKGMNFYDRSVMIDDATTNFLIVGE